MLVIMKFLVRESFCQSEALFEHSNNLRIYVHGKVVTIWCLMSPSCASRFHKAAFAFPKHLVFELVL